MAIKNGDDQDESELKLFMPNKKRKRESAKHPPALKSSSKRKPSQSRLTRSQRQHLLDKASTPDNSVNLYRTAAFFSLGAAKKKKSKLGKKSRAAGKPHFQRKLVFAIPITDQDVRHKSHTQLTGDNDPAIIAIKHPMSSK